MCSQQQCRAVQQEAAGSSCVQQKSGITSVLQQRFAAEELGLACSSRLEGQPVAAVPSSSRLLDRFVGVWVSRL